MATKFPKFSQALAQDPATRRIWYGIATAHDLEAHDGMTEENLYQKIFASHFGHLAIIFLWTSGNLFHVAWQGNFEKWVGNPPKCGSQIECAIGLTFNGLPTHFSKFPCHATWNKLPEVHKKITAKCPKCDAKIF